MTFKREHTLVIDLSKYVVGESTAELELHVASASVLFCPYLEPARPFKGPPFETCQVLAAEHYSELVVKIAELEKRTTVLGGTPRCNPLEQTNVAHPIHEPERFSLEAARERSDLPQTRCPEH